MNPLSSESLGLEVSLKTLWGAQRWPGFSESSVVVSSPPWSEALGRLHQLLAVHSSGVLHGPHGVGKSFLISHWTRNLSPKQYKVVRLSHSSLMGSDLLRQMVSLAGKKPLFRRGDNVLELQALWQQWAPLWPVLIIEEAQDLNAAALEELRLLTTSRSDTQIPFSLILVGDQDLLGRLEMGINQALISRMGFCLSLPLWTKEHLANYLQERLKEVGIHSTPLESAAQELLLQSAQGSPRRVNHLLQRALEQAAMAQRRLVTLAEVQAALDQMPWIAPRHRSSSP